MNEEISIELEKLSTELTPLLGQHLEGVDYKPAIIYFAGLLKTLMDDMDDSDFNKIIIQYITNGGENVPL